MSKTKRKKKQAQKANDWDRLDAIIKIKERSLNMHIAEMDELRNKNKELEAEVRKLENTIIELDLKLRTRSTI